MDFLYAMFCNFLCIAVSHILLDYHHVFHIFYATVDGIVIIVVFISNVLCYCIEL